MIQKKGALFSMKRVTDGYNAYEAVRFLAETGASPEMTDEEIEEEIKAYISGETLLPWHLTCRYTARCLKCYPRRKGVAL